MKILNLLVMIACAIILIFILLPSARTLDEEFEIPYIDEELLRDKDNKE